MYERPSEVLSVRWKSDLDRIEFEAVAIDKGVAISDLARTAIFDRIEAHFAESPGGREAVMRRYMAARERLMQQEIESLQADTAAIQALIEDSL